MKRIFLLFFLFTACLSADDIEEIQIDTLLPAVDHQGLGWVHGCVHVISGSLCLNERDLSLPGSQPMPFSRSYSSGSSQWLSLHTGWDIDPLSWCFLERTGSKPWFDEFEPKSKIYYFTQGAGVVSSKGHHVPEGTVLTTLHNGPASYEGWCSPKFVEGGKTHRKNITYAVEDPFPTEPKTVTIRDGSGAVRKFQSHDTFRYQSEDLAKANEHLILPIEQITHPNRFRTTFTPDLADGNLVTYKKTTPGFTKISHFSPLGTLVGTYTLKPHYQRKDRTHTHQLTVEASSGRKVRYTLEPHKVGKENKYFYLSRVEHFATKNSNAHLTQTYEYTSIPGSPHKRLSKKKDPLGRFLKIDYLDSGLVHTLADPLGTLYTFSYQPGKTTVTDANHHTTTYSYQNHRLTQISEPSRTTHFSWSDDGLLLTKSVVDHKTHTYTYDSSGNLTKETLTSPLSATLTKTYTYTKNRLHTVLTPRTKTTFSYLANTDLVTSIVQTGHTLQRRQLFEYNDDHFLITKIQDDGPDATYRKITRIVPERHLPKQITYAYWNPATQQEEEVRRELFVYNPDGKATLKAVQIYRTDHWQTVKTWTWSYDPFGCCTQAIDPQGAITTYTYDALGNLLTETIGTRKQTHEYNPRNLRIRTTYEGEGIPSLTETWAYDPMGQLLTHTNIAGQTTCTFHDALGRCTTTQYPSTPTPSGTLYPTATTSAYDALDHKTVQIDGNGHKTTFRRNIYGDPTYIQHPNGVTETKRYTADGFLNLETLPDGRQIHTLYDPFGRLFSQKCGPSFTAYHYNAYFLLSKTENNLRTTHYQYNFRGLLTQESTGTTRTQYFYDALDRVTAVRRCLDDTHYVQENREYDIVDRLTRRYTTDETNQITQDERFTYNIHGDCLTHTRLIDGEEAVTQTLYDAFGNPILTSDPLGHLTHFVREYKKNHLTTFAPDGTQQLETKDALGRLWKKTTFNASGEPVQSQEWCHDANDRPLQLLTHVIQGCQPLSTQTTTFTYDSRGRLILQKEGPKETHYSYDSCGRKSRIIKPDGTHLHSTYDAQGRLSTHSDSTKTFAYHYTYDDLDRPIQITNTLTGKTTNRLYDLFDRIVQETLENGETLSRTFDALGRPTVLQFSDHSRVVYSYSGPFLSRVDRFDSQDALLYSHTYTRNSQGQVLHETLPLLAGTHSHSYDLAGRWLSHEHPAQTFHALDYDARSHLTALSHNDTLHTFTYDPLEQLTSESTDTYTYDSVYNRLSKNSLSSSYNDLNQLTSLPYDPNGNLLALPGKILAYDGLDRLTSVTLENTRALYDYDPFHRRMSKTLQQKTPDGWLTTQKLFFAYDGTKEIGHRTLENTYVRRILGQGLSSDIGATLAIENDTELLVPLHTPFGNLGTLLDADTGSVVQTLRSTAFGELTLFGPTGEPLPLSSARSPWLFSSKRFDPETGFSVFLRRYYSPALGRWLTPDPAGFLDGPNLYQYLKNNPLKYLDPDGQLTFAIPLLQYTAQGAVIVAEKILEIIAAAVIGAIAGWHAYPKGNSKEEEAPYPYPGDDPSECPADGFEWKGKGSPESQKGSWYNPATDESLHPDLDHPVHGPHWDYQREDEDGKTRGRIYPDGSYEEKSH